MSYVTGIDRTNTSDLETSNPNTANQILKINYLN